MESHILEKTDQITNEYLNNNEFGEFEQFYEFYIVELSNIKPGRTPTRNEIRTYLRNKVNLEYDEQKDIFWLKNQKIELIDTYKYENLNELFNWKVVISVSIISGTRLKNNFELEKDLSLELEIPNKEIYQSGPFLTICWEVDSYYVEIKIRNTSIEISSYLI